VRPLLRSGRVGDTPEKLAEDARRARRDPPYVYRSTAVPALKAAAVMWIFRGPVALSYASVRSRDLT
jgi:hypothetical protein